MSLQYKSVHHSHPTSRARPILWLSPSRNVAFEVTCDRLMLCKKKEIICAETGGDAAGPLKYKTPSRRSVTLRRSGEDLLLCFSPRFYSFIEAKMSFLKKFFKNVIHDRDPDDTVTVSIRSDQSYRTGAAAWCACNIFLINVHFLSSYVKMTCLLLVVAPGKGQKETKVLRNNCPVPRLWPSKWRLKSEEFNWIKRYVCLLFCHRTFTVSED